MKRLGINFFQHWKSSRVCVLPLFSVLNMFMAVVSRSGCTGMATASVMPRAVSFSSAWMRRLHRMLLPVSFPLMCVRTQQVLIPIC